MRKRYENTEKLSFTKLTITKLNYQQKSIINGGSLIGVGAPQLTNTITDNTNDDGSNGQIMTGNPDNTK